MTAPSLIQSNKLEKATTAQVEALMAQLSSHQAANTEKALYYEGEQIVQQFGIAVPPNMRNVKTVSGWAGTAVDTLEERLDWQGWIETDLDLGLGDVYRANDLDVDSGLAHLDALIYGTAFAAVGTGARGEPSPLVTVESPRNMTGTFDPRLGRLSAALSQVVSENGDVLAATLYLPDETVQIVRQNSGSPWLVASRDEHKLGRVPVAQIVNRPRAGRLGGRSEISQAVRYYTDVAVRTMLAMEVNREFYTSPQRYVLGADEEAFVDQSGNNVPGWQTIMGRVLALGRDEDGNMPEVGQFQQSSQGPYMETIRGAAQLLAAECGFPASYLGFTTENPASADAIRQAESRLIKRAERRQSMFGKSWLEVARLCLLVRDGAVPAEFDSVSVKWRDAATPTRSAAADEAVKLISAGVFTPDSTVTYDRIGLSPQDQRQLASDKRRAGMSSLLQRLPSAVASVGPDVQALASQRAGE